MTMTWLEGFINIAWYYHYLMFNKPDSNAIQLKTMNAKTQSLAQDSLVGRCRTDPRPPVSY
jgi:hypothetical protein